jgi:hypothetical protein
VKLLLQNNPIHIQPTSDDATTALKFDYITFVGLDAVDNIMMEHKEKSTLLTKPVLITRLF